MKTRLNWVFVNSIQMFAGGEIWMLTAMRGLRDRGHRISLICRPGTELARRAAEDGFPVFTMSFRGDFDPVSILKAAKILRKLRPDGILTNMDKELRIAGLAAKIVGVPVVLPRRGSDYPLKNHLAYRFSYTKLATAVLANSESTKRTLLKNAPWLPPQRVRVIYNGINPEPYLSPPKKNLREEWGISENDFVVGFVGQLDERKGIQDLLEGFRQFVETRKEATLFLCGAGPLQSKVEQFARENGLESRIKLAGFRNDIPEVMKMIDVLVLPSLWEGFGIVVIEAMAAARPVIVSRASNLPEIVSEREGILVPPHAPQELARAFERLAAQPDLRRKLGKNGRERVQRFFTRDRMIRALESYFFELVNERQK
ncbi:MAG: glycosyltransferase [Calditrichaeota bacterium]|nr:glycosyltransferase [Calditrichota bacterium]